MWCHIRLTWFKRTLPTSRQKPLFLYRPGYPSSISICLSNLNTKAHICASWQFMKPSPHETSSKQKCCHAFLDAQHTKTWKLDQHGSTRYTHCVKRCDSAGRHNTRNIAQSTRWWESQKTTRIAIKHSPGTFWCWMRNFRITGRPCFLHPCKNTMWRLLKTKENEVWGKLGTISNRNWSVGSSSFPTPSIWVIQHLGFVRSAAWCVGQLALLCLMTFSFQPNGQPFRLTFTPFAEQRSSVFIAPSSFEMVIKGNILERASLQDLSSTEIVGGAFSWISQACCAAGIKRFQFSPRRPWQIEKNTSSNSFTYLLHWFYAHKQSRKYGLKHVTQFQWNNTWCNESNYEW